VLKTIFSYLSPFAFTHALLPLLVATAKQPGSDVRIVNVRAPAVLTVHNNSDLPLKLSSRGHRFLAPGIQFRTIDDLNRECKGYMWPEMSRYGLSKLAIVLWTKKLQRQFDAEGVPITAISIHPGEVCTGKALYLCQPTLFILSSQRVPMPWRCHGSCDPSIVSLLYLYHSFQSRKVSTRACSQPLGRRSRKNPRTIEAPSLIRSHSCRSLRMIR